MRKMFCTAAVALVVGTAAFGQDNFIELVVRDTMTVQPKAWLYTVDVTPIYDVSMVSVDTAYTPLSTPPPVAVPPVPKELPQAAKGTTVAEVTALAKKFGGQPASDENDFLAVKKPSAYSESTATFRFTSLQSLKNFVQALAALKDVDGRIVNIVPAESQPVMAALDTRLISTARKRAENLAAVSGRKLGEVLLITEDYGNGTSFLQTLIEDIFKYDVLGKSSRRWPLAYDAVAITRSLKVRFALR